MSISLSGNNPITLSTTLTINSTSFNKNAEVNVPIAAVCLRLSFLYQWQHSEDIEDGSGKGHGGRVGVKGAIFCVGFALLVKFKI
jgi:hypothetical protein